jgi:eukaryotic-like serine/threonine-protein kinase
VGTTTTNPGEQVQELAAYPSRIGRFTVRGVLGRGSMGLVLDAVGPNGRAVALKLLRTPSDPDRAEIMTARFLREVKILSRLEHPAIVRLLEAGEVDSELYLAMERVEGKSLEELRLDGPFELERVMSVGISLADGITHLHALGVVHRDLKPANILLDAEGRAVIADFGISRDEETTGVTQHGALLGTPGYMAPELLDGDPATPLSDQYALGRVLFDLGTRAKPATVPTDRPLLEMIIAGLGFDWNTWPDGPGWDRLGEIVRRMVSEKPMDRYSSAAIVARELRELEIEVARAQDAEPSWSESPWEEGTSRTLTDGSGTGSLPPPSQPIPGFLLSTLTPELPLELPIDRRSSEPADPAETKPAPKTSAPPLVRGASVPPPPKAASVPPAKKSSAPPPKESVPPAPSYTEEELALLTAASGPVIPVKSIEIVPSGPITEGRSPANEVPAPVIEPRASAPSQPTTPEPKANGQIETMPEVPAEDRQEAPLIPAKETVLEPAPQGTSPEPLPQDTLRDAAPSVSAHALGIQTITRYERQITAMREQLATSKKKARSSYLFGLLAATPVAIAIGVALGWYYPRPIKAPARQVVILSVPTDPVEGSDQRPQPSSKDLEDGRTMLVLAKEALLKKDFDSATRELRLCIEIADLPECRAILASYLSLIGDPEAATHLGRYLKRTQDLKGYPQPTGEAGSR